MRDLSATQPLLQPVGARSLPYRKAVQVAVAAMRKEMKEYAVSANLAESYHEPLFNVALEKKNMLKAAIETLSGSILLRGK